ncbi:hypothetical protein [Sediminicola luteus]|uniref:Uncharacterized protein n=1 Tax=Sediminicola luteus TaxID=319238 RepID=A0A2A4GCC6_9FLAO|nr:hypothetical protein [Sediminicola luteus]PCE66609.1 hypothetical protein B7P33_04755 [Sediminicola luteus]
MEAKSTFYDDLHKERALAKFLDSQYRKYLRLYHFKRIRSTKKQKAGIDLELIHKTSGKSYAVDEKAQLDYLNESLPTFAFELQYQLYGKTKPGWLFDPLKTTEFYALVTSIYSDEDDVFTACNLYFVNREKLIGSLKTHNIGPHTLGSFLHDIEQQPGLHTWPGLCRKTEGYFYVTHHKAERPINIILRLDYLVAKKVAKRLF